VDLMPFQDFGFADPGGGGSPRGRPAAEAQAHGVAEGRRIFANTIKYFLMGTSSNRR
jgi:hypothetical protein